MAEEVGLRVGSVLGKCEIVRELGRGGMGTVYVARHRTLDLEVAVKVLSPEACRSSSAVERFLREARLAARIRHANLVEVMDTDTDPVTGASYMVMELVTGASVAALISSGPIEPALAARIGLGVSLALEAAYEQNVIHRDIKPANILLDARGAVKLVDLGLAKDLAFDGQLTSSAATLGTPLYMSPEQVRRSDSVDIRTDIYSLGVSLFEMLTGQLPFRGTSFYEVADQITKAPVPDPRELKPDLDPAFATLVMRMMAKDPATRPQIPAEVVAALEPLAAKMPVSMSSPSLLRLSGLIGQRTPPVSFRGASPTDGADTPTLAAPPPPPPDRTAMKLVVATTALLIVGFVGWRLGGGRPIGGGPGGVPPDWHAGPGPGQGDSPPPPPWWRDAWGKAPPIPWGYTYGPPPEWALAPDGRPPAGWKPSPQPAHGGPPPGPPPR